jgi:hypothetical protein
LRSLDFSAAALLLGMTKVENVITRLVRVIHPLLYVETKNKWGEWGKLLVAF